LMRNYRDTPDKFDPSRPPFQVTQGHWNWHGLIAPPITTY